jgi:hypothetical protein
VTVRWRATAESFDGVIEGELTVPVSSKNAQELYEERVASPRRS